MSIKSITIPAVEVKYTADYIAHILWSNNIAQPNLITMVPYLRDDMVYNIVYIGIEFWCDSEVAFNFIKKLQDPLKEVRLVHNSDDWWNVEINKHNSGTNYLYPYSKKFDKTFFNKKSVKNKKNPLYEKVLPYEQEKVLPYELEKVLPYELEKVPLYELEEGELISMEA
jgi:hypothetical protein